MISICSICLCFGLLVLLCLVNVLVGTRVFIFSKKVEVTSLVGKKVALVEPGQLLGEHVQKHAEHKFVETCGEKLRDSCQG